METRAHGSVGSSPPGGGRGSPNRDWAPETPRSWGSQARKRAQRDPGTREATQQARGGLSLVPGPPRRGPGGPVAWDHWWWWGGFSETGLGMLSALVQPGIRVPQHGYSLGCWVGSGWCWWWRPGQDVMLSARGPCGHYQSKISMGVDLGGVPGQSRGSQVLAISIQQGQSRRGSSRVTACGVQVGPGFSAASPTWRIRPVPTHSKEARGLTPQ